MSEDLASVMNNFVEYIQRKDIITKHLSLPEPLCMAVTELMMMQTTRTLSSSQRKRKVPSGREAHPSQLRGCHCLLLGMKYLLYQYKLVDTV